MSGCGCWGHRPAHLDHAGIELGNVEVTERGLGAGKADRITIENHSCPNNIENHSLFQYRPARSTSYPYYTSPTSILPASLRHSSQLLYLGHGIRRSQVAPNPFNKQTAVRSGPAGVGACREFEVNPVDKVARRIRLAPTIRARKTPYTPS
jgi:hypothetical protein